MLIPLLFLRYQLDLCEKALKENVVVFLETGCGKTHIAILLIYEMGHLIRKPQKNICIFLAPTVALVQQVPPLSYIFLSVIILTVLRLQSHSDISVL